MESCFPDFWKAPSMAPVSKNVGERGTTKNYLPVSVLSVVSKVIEKLVNNSDFQFNVSSSQSIADLLTTL